METASIFLSNFARADFAKVLTAKGIDAVTPTVEANQVLFDSF
jgi:hypothetical protein